MTISSRPREASAPRGGDYFQHAEAGITDTQTPPPPYSQTDNLSGLPPVERYVRADGKIAVIISNRRCSGWSTRVQLLLDLSIPANASRARRMEEIAIFDKDVVAAVLAGDTSRARAIAVAKMEWPSQFFPDNIELRILWVARGDEFEITYDLAYDLEYERIRRKEEVEWWRA